MRDNRNYLTRLLPLFLALTLTLAAGPLIRCNGQEISFSVSMDQAALHKFHVTMRCRGLEDSTVTLIMPTWTPGYYQKLDFAKHVSNLKAYDGKGDPIGLVRNQEFSWITQGYASTLILEYDVLAERNFVATPYLDPQRAYIVPGGLFFYPEGKIASPVTIHIVPHGSWSHMVTGLERVEGEDNTFAAQDYDVLYDSPLLIGDLDYLPSFRVRGVSHHFAGYRLGNFDQAALVGDLERMVETASGIFGEIPYDHFTFIGIGPGRGGIEHANSTTVSFDGNRLATARQYLDVLFFLTHEYFHTYNVKRIRPMELGPFDYVNGSRTNLLWVSEGLTVYYEYLVMKRAGLCSEAEFLRAFQGNIKAHETRPGRLVQSLAEASYQTWRDGPFGGMGDGAEKTISYYDKGPLVGLFLDLRIRQATGNSRSLDDVMRRLYNQYYREKGRGFTEAEFRTVCEETAGAPLDDIFEYVYTTRELNFDRYLGLAGYVLDRDEFAIRELPFPTDQQKRIREGWLNGSQ